MGVVCCNAVSVFPLSFLMDLSPSSTTLLTVHLAKLKRREASRSCVASRRKRSCYRLPKSPGVIPLFPLPPPLGTTRMAAKPRPGQSFSQFASKVLSSTFLESTPQDAPVSSTSPRPRRPHTPLTPSALQLFYSTANWEVSVAGEDDILGRSDDSLPLHSSSRVGEGRGLSLDSDREEEREEDREETGAPGFPSRLWERARLPLGGVSRGWRAHESVLPPPPADIYSSEYDDSDTPDSPPSFLSPALPLPQAPLTEPLLPATTLYIYPSTRSLGGGGGAQVYRNSRWIAAYGCCILAVSYLGVREWWAGTADVSPPPSTLPRFSS